MVIIFNDIEGRKWRFNLEGLNQRDSKRFLYYLAGFCYQKNPFTDYLILPSLDLQLLTKLVELYPVEESYKGPAIDFYTAPKGIGPQSREGPCLFLPRSKIVFIK